MTRRAAVALAVLALAMPARAEGPVVDEPPPAPAAGAAAPATGAAVPPPRPPRPDPSPRITAAEILHDVAWLADDARAGRLAGTPGADAAATWIAERFTEAGAEPPPGATRFQEFPLPASEPLPDGCSLHVEGPGGASFTAAPGATFVILGGRDAAIDAPAVFVGYGISRPDDGYDDYAGIDVAGKVALVLRHEPREKDPGAERWGGTRMTVHSFLTTKAVAAQKAGAAALLLVNDPLHHDTDSPAGLGTGAIPASVTIPVVFASRAAADALLAGAPSLPDLQRAIDTADAPASRTLPHTRVRLRTAFVRRSARNVLAAVRGTDAALRDQWVVVGAHYDHVGDGSGGGIDGRAHGEIHNGADDNASGTAVLLELARSLAAPGGAPRRSVLLVAFSGEELGLLGAAHHVEHPVVPLASMVAMLNLDMVGRYRKGTFEVVGAASGTGLADVVARAAEGLDLEYRHTNVGLDRSDGFHFHAKRIPTLFLFTGLHREYHRPGDDWWHVDAAAAERIATMALRIVMAVGNADGRPEFREVAREAMRPQARHRARLGVTFLDESDVAILGSVLPGTPAAAAGLQQGDRLVRFGTAEVGSPADVRAALAEVAPGAVVEIVYLREGRRATARVEFPK